MVKNVKLFLVCLIVFSLFGFGFSSFGVQDNFEDGNANGWTNNGYCSVSVDSYAAFNDNYGLNITHASTAGDCIMNKSVSGVDDEYSVWFNAPHAFSAAGFQELDLKVSTTHKIMMRQHSSGFVCITQHGGWNYVYLSCGSHPLINTWYMFKIDYVSGASNASCYVYDSGNNLLCSSINQSVTPFTPNTNDIQMGDDGGGLIAHWDNFGYWAGNDTYAGESQGRTAIENGIRESVIGSAAVYTDQSIYAKYLNNNQYTSNFDKVVKYGNQTWAFNYVMGSDAYSSMLNISTSLYTWEKTNLTTTAITAQVRALINSTKI